MECGDSVWLIIKLLYSFAKCGFKLKVLLEVVVPKLIVYLYYIIELLRVLLIALPKLVDMLLRNSLYLFPSLLYILEAVI
ncbi:hypothetical protein EVA_13556 [gut metagenome]|uniref:Uncharacterized protein n=1 Tax=gut metagenome TaxID=749906 RepID=J9G989_9ZZZZ